MAPSVLWLRLSARFLVAKVPQRDIGTPATAIQFSKIQREFVTSAANPAHPAFAVSHTPLAALTVSAAFGAYLNAIGHSVPAAKVKPVAAAAKFPASNPTPTAAAATTSTSSSPSPSTSGHPGSAFAQMGCGDPVFMHWGVKGIYRTYASRFDALTAVQKLQIPSSDVFGDADPAVVEAWCKCG
ncbi:hypothetical protein B0H13DRAFT_1935850 [Mycena leptocephala]|nr:hypothetical protein B0H13DRAFT_1935850 [Mycena leptocephala]